MWLIVGTELDEHGNVRVGMQAFKKVELCTMVLALLNHQKLFLGIYVDHSMAYYLAI